MSKKCAKSYKIAICRLLITIVNNDNGKIIYAFKLEICIEGFDVFWYFVISSGINEYNY